jgi:hypothetical protein
MIKVAAGSAPALRGRLVGNAGAASPHVHSLETRALTAAFLPQTFSVPAALIAAALGFVMVSFLVATEYRVKRGAGIVENRSAK